MKDVPCCIMIPIHHPSAVWTAIDSNLQTYFHPPSTIRALLRSESGRNGHDHFAEHFSVVVHPGEKAAPSGIVDALGETMVFHHVFHLKLFVGDQVVRPNERTCSLCRKVFTLPTHFQVSSYQSHSRLASVPAAFFLSGKPFLKLFQSLLRLSERLQTGDFLPA